MGRVFTEVISNEKLVDTLHWDADLGDNRSDPQPQRSATAAIRNRSDPQPQRSATATIRNRNNPLALDEVVIVSFDSDGEATVVTDLPPATTGSQLRPFVRESKSRLNSW